MDPATRAMIDASSRRGAFLPPALWLAAALLICGVLVLGARLPDAGRQPGETGSFA